MIIMICMIEIVIIGIILICLLIVSIIFAYTLYRREEIKAEIAHNKFLIDKRKLRKASREKDDDLDDEVDDFIESLPPWLTAIAEGAKIDLEKVYEGDQNELLRVKDILDKNLSKVSNTNPGAGDLIG